MSGIRSFITWLRALRRVDDARQRIGALEGRLARAARELESSRAAHETTVRALLAEIRGGAAAIGHLEARLTEHVKAVAASFENQGMDIRARMDVRFAEERERVEGVAHELGAVSTRLERIAPPMPPADAVGGEWTDLSFAGMFRGSTSDIESRLAIYVDDVAAAAQRTSGGIVIDVGCGRGEWLALLQREGVAAFGIDDSPEAVAHCRVAGLDARQGDAVELLREQPAKSAGAITAFHVVEHMPYAALATLLVEARRVLRPYGILVIETPNCENVVVGANTFWLDPTHVRPYPLHLLQFLVTRAGFLPKSVHRLHADAALTRRADEERLPPLLREWVTTGQDAAIVAVLPDT
jgi:O-antigen chain-terminating methyltransferase